MLHASLLSALIFSAQPAPANSEPVAISAEAPCAADGDIQLHQLPEGIIEAKTTRMGTNLQLGLSGIGCKESIDVYKAVYTEFDRLEQLISDEGDSDIAKVNQQAGIAPVVINSELLALIEKALLFARQTGGAFDPTFAIMKGLWVFGEIPKVPSESDVENLLDNVDYRKVKINKANKTVFLEEKGMRLELGGIAKGYAIDRAVAILTARGITDFVLRSGGELYLSGNPGGGNRRVGIPDPRGKSAFALLDIKNAAMNISSDNEKFFIKDGVRFHDKINPTTGRPATASRSCAVVAKNATDADALSTALFIMGAEKGMLLVEKLDGVEAIMVDNKNRVYLSSGLGKGRFELRAPTP